MTISQPTAEQISRNLLAMYEVLYKKFWEEILPQTLVKDGQPSHLIEELEEVQAADHSSVPTVTTPAAPEGVSAPELTPSLPASAKAIPVVPTAPVLEVPPAPESTSPIPSTTENHPALGQRSKSYSDLAMFRIIYGPDSQQDGRNPENTILADRLVRFMAQSRITPSNLGLEKALLVIAQLIPAINSLLAQKVYLLTSLVDVSAENSKFALLIHLFELAIKLSDSNLRITKELSEDPQYKLLIDFIYDFRQRFAVLIQAYLRSMPDQDLQAFSEFSRQPVLTQHNAIPEWSKMAQYMIQQVNIERLLKLPATALKFMATSNGDYNTDAEKIFFRDLQAGLLEKSSQDVGFLCQVLTDPNYKNLDPIIRESLEDQAVDLIMAGTQLPIAKKLPKPVLKRFAEHLESLFKEISEIEEEQKLLLELLPRARTPEEEIVRFNQRLAAHLIAISDLAKELGHDEYSEFLEWEIVNEEDPQKKLQDAEYVRLQLMQEFLPKVLSRQFYADLPRGIRKATESRILKMLQDPVHLLEIYNSFEFKKFPPSIKSKAEKHAKVMFGSGVSDNKNFLMQVNNLRKTRGERLATYLDRELHKQIVELIQKREDGVCVFKDLPVFSESYIERLQLVVGSLSPKIEQSSIPGDKSLISGSSELKNDMFARLSKGHAREQGIIRKENALLPKIQEFIRTPGAFAAFVEKLRGILSSHTELPSARLASLRDNLIVLHDELKKEPLEPGEIRGCILAVGEDLEVMRKHYERQEVDPAYPKLIVPPTPAERAVLKELLEISKFIPSSSHDESAVAPSAIASSPLPPPMTGHAPLGSDLTPLPPADSKDALPIHPSSSSISVMAN